MNNTYKNFLSRWCDQLWLYATYFLGLIMLYLLIWNWDSWSFATKLMCFFAFSVPLHVFEENTLPGGFPFMNNLNYKGADPLIYPQNRCTNMITNLGATIVTMVLTYFADAIAPSIMTFIVFFNVSQTIFHTRCGVQMHKRYEAKGKRTIYGPGMISCWTVMIPTAVLALKWLVLNGVTGLQIAGGIGIMLGIALPLILLPFAISIRVKSQEFALRDLGYFKKYEN